MKAHVGEWVVIEGRTLDDPRRQGEIIEVAHADGAPPYRVRWMDGHESLVFPGPSARIEPHPVPPAVRLHSWPEPGVPSRWPLPNPSAAPQPG